MYKLRRKFIKFYILFTYNTYFTKKALTFKKLL